MALQALWTRGPSVIKRIGPRNGSLYLCRLTFCVIDDALAFFGDVVRLLFSSFFCRAGSCPALNVTLSPLSVVSGEKHDHADSETDTAIPDDDIAFVASCSFESVQASSLQLPGSLPCGRGCFRLAMALPHDHADHLLRCPVSLDDLHLENIFEDNGVSGQVADEMLAPEMDTTADLPPHSALFSQQLLEVDRKGDPPHQ